jgi:hypothetical protein
VAELVPGSPWRDVVHIEEGVGSRGGAYWSLTLACDHVAVRHRPRLHMRDVPAEVAFAPGRVRCYTCGHQAQDRAVAGETRSTKPPEADLTGINPARRAFP